MDAVEMVGYVASALVVASLTMSSLLRLRVVSLVGSLVFATYGLLIGSVPVILTNAAITVINLVHLRRLWRDRTSRGYFEVVPADPSSAVLQRFVAFHARDMRRFQPQFTGLRPDHLAWWVLRDAVPAGVVLARRADATTLEVEADYVTEAHRDFEPGLALYGESGAFLHLAVDRVVSAPGSPAHRRYLERMGFTPDGEVWTREVTAPAA